jgi:cytochrome c556
MRIALALLLLLPVQDEKRGPRNAEVRKAYRAIMKDVEKENDALKKDLEAKKADAAIKERLKAIRKGVEAASKLDYLKGPEKDVEEFKALFGIFLDIRMKTFLDSEWTPESSEKLYERLQSACRTCHELYRD